MKFRRASGMAGQSESAAKLQSTPTAGGSKNLVLRGRHTSRAVVRAACQQTADLVRELAAELPRITRAEALHEAANVSPTQIAALEAQMPGFTELYLAALVAASSDRDATEAALRQTTELFVEFYDRPHGAAN